MTAGKNETERRGFFVCLVGVSMWLGSACITVVGDGEVVSLMSASRRLRFTGRVCCAASDEQDERVEAVMIDNNGVGLLLLIDRVHMVVIEKMSRDLECRYVVVELQK